VKVGLPTPVHPIQCAADVAKLAEDAASIKTSVDGVTSTCDKTHSDDCIVSLNDMLTTVDSTLVDAEKAFDDCSDGTASQCNEDISGILAVLGDASKDLEEDLADCVDIKIGSVKQCVKDVVETGKTAVGALKDILEAFKDCKGDGEAVSAF
jgi:dihydroxyacetone kinase-like predicted kinase